MIDNFEVADKSLQELMEDEISALLPRQATVTHSEGMGVWVRFPGESAGGTFLPSVPAGVPAGTVGLVYPVAGKKGLFVAMGIAVPIPFATATGNVHYSTTSITTSEIVGTASITVPPGSYRVVASGVVPTKRNDAQGGARALLQVGDVAGEESPYGLYAAGILANEWFTITCAIDAELTTTGEVPLRFGFRGTGTAGTTSIYQAVMHGTLTRIG